MAAATFDTRAILEAASAAGERATSFFPSIFAHALRSTKQIDES
jgi:hypothetical protein